MRRSTTPFSWARFIMLSLSGARQISGKSVRMSMLMSAKKTSDTRRRTSNTECCSGRQDGGSYNSLYNLECGTVTVTRGRTIEQRTYGMNGLPAATNDTADVALAQLHFEHRY